MDPANHLLPFLQHQASNAKLMSYQLSPDYVLVTFPSWSGNSTRPGYIWVDPQMNHFCLFFITRTSESCPPQIAHPTGENWSPFHQWELRNVGRIPSLWVYSQQEHLKQLVVKCSMWSPEPAVCWISVGLHASSTLMPFRLFPALIHRLTRPSLFS